MNTETPTQTLVLTKGEKASKEMTIGLGAVLAKVASDFKKSDREAVNEAGSISRQEVDATITDNNTGATVTVTGNATVGLDTTGIRFNKYGTKSALRLLLAVTGFNRDNISNQLIEALAEDDIPAAIALLGISTDAVAKADALIESLGTESTVVVSGRQQATKVTTA